MRNGEDDDERYLLSSHQQSTSDATRAAFNYPTDSFAFESSLEILMIKFAIMMRRERIAS